MAKKARVEVTDADVKRSIVRGERYDRDPLRPRATAVKYRPESDTFELQLATGVGLLIPTRLLQGLENAGPRNLAQVALEDDGRSLHWDALDVDHFVPGLIDGIFGTRKWMREAGKIGGASQSAAKCAASRVNGRKGGRPRKVTAP